ncbi:MAG: DUF423 domain-containing protein [Gammaproteobacteria bacterium]|nr:MAG: DUF423 domain-containing protein [Gammaproteobacteria bacterium]
MNDAARYILITGALLAMLAVILGAFGAHALKKTLTDDMLTVYKTAVDYHFIHALGIILIGILIKQNPESTLLFASAVSLIIGVVVFSGSLYALSLTETRILGMITPLGGLAFIIGWLLMAVGIFRL